MFKTMNICARAALAAMLIAVSGCEGDDDKSEEDPEDAVQETEAPPIVVNIEGAWAGTYTHPEIQEGITANINQAGSSVTIQTSRSGEAEHFTGYFLSDGSLRLTDSGTGEIWSSIGGVGSHSFTIRDYLPNTPTNHLVQYVSLSR